MEPFIGQIIMFGGNFAPRGWALCDGQLLPISSNQALFSILGTIYGGDGRTTFGLPELRGRYAMHAGNGPGLSNRALGSKSGVEDVTLTANEIPSHNHAPALHAEFAGATEANPTGNMLAVGSGGTQIYAPFNANDNIAMSTESITSNNVGGSQSHTNMPPYQAVNFIIALTGTFPSRN